MSSISTPVFWNVLLKCQRLWAVVHWLLYQVISTNRQQQNKWNINWIFDVFFFPANPTITDTSHRNSSWWCVSLHSNQCHFDYRRSNLFGNRIVLQGYSSSHQRRFVCVACRFSCSNQSHETSRRFNEIGIGPISWSRRLRPIRFRFGCYHPTIVEPWCSSYRIVETRTIRSNGNWRASKSKHSIATTVLSRIAESFTYCLHMLRFILSSGVHWKHY